MAMPCATCTSEQRDAIEAAIIANPSMSAVGRQFGMNRDALSRHRDNHMSPAIRAAMDARRSPQDTTPKLLDRVLTLLVDAQDILATAKADGKPSIALAAIREARGLLDTYGRATGELKPDGANVTVQVLNVATNPEWQAIKQALFRTFERLPNGDEARLIFAEEMRSIEGYSEPAPKQIGARAIAPYREQADDEEVDEEDMIDAR